MDKSDDPYAQPHPGGYGRQGHGRIALAIGIGILIGGGCVSQFALHFTALPSACPGSLPDVPSPAFASTHSLAAASNDIGCGATWGQFGSGPLAATALNPEQTGWKTHGLSAAENRDFKQVFVDVESRFAFCQIHKVGSSAWARVLWKIMTKNATLQAPLDGLYYPHSNVWQQLRDRGISPKQAINLTINDVFGDPTATRVVFVREPLARFASAFLDKCFAGCAATSDRHACPFRRPDQVGQAISMKQAIEAFRRLDPTQINGHYRLQSTHCGLERQLKHYNVIGYMQPSTLAKESSCVMKKAGLDWFDRGASEDEPFWKPLKEQAERWGNGLNPGDAMKYKQLGEFAEQDILKKLFTYEAGRSLIDHLHKDYATFLFPAEPDWLRHATGEWYTSSSKSCLKPWEYKPGGTKARLHDTWAPVLRSSAR